MFSVAIIFLTILIPSLQSSKPTLKLTFSPDEKYYAQGASVDINCELLNPPEDQVTAQLWHVDLKTGKHTPVSRALVTRPTEDAPELFRRNRDRHFEYLRKNFLRINGLQIEDSSRYECTCPDCEEQLGKQGRDLLVMKLSDPKWHIEPGWPIQENARTTIKCTVDDFFPYVSHQIFHRHHDITKEGKAVTPNSNTYPQNFSWEHTITPTYDWHNTSLECIVTEGNTKREEKRYLEVIFTPRFLTCAEKQHVDSSKDKSSIHCSYAGNPAPKLTWFRQTDDKPIMAGNGITIDVVDEHHGKYKSVLTFEREKLAAIPLSTTTKSPTGQPSSSTAKPAPSGDNYYQQLLNGGFVAKLSHHDEEKGSRKIAIVGDPNQARSKLSGNSSPKTFESFSTSLLFLFSFVLVYLIQHH